MTAQENPKWTEDFQSILINEFNISKTDSIFIIGSLLKILRVNGLPRSQEELNILLKENGNK